MNNNFKLEWNGAQITKEVNKDTSKILKDAAEFVLDVSNTRAPIDEGNLIRSGKVTVNGNEAAISYDTPYAVKQHEDLSLKHKNGRRGKYLESALRDEAKRALAYIADNIKDRLT